MKAQIKSNPRHYLIILLVFMTFLLNSCTNNKIVPVKTFYLLGINDVYRAEGLNNGKVGGLARVRTLRKQLIAENKNVIIIHAGDFLYPSFSSRVNKGAAMIDAMNQLNGLNQAFDNDMIVTFGNHEFDKSKLKHQPQLQQRIDESDFNWLDSNINWKRDDNRGAIHSNKLHKWLIKDISGLKVGFFSLTTNMAHPAFIASFDNPIEVTKHYVPFLKSQGADIVIALTHQRMSDDKKLLKLAPQYRPNLIFGGHEHYRQLEQVNGTWIIKADADALSAAVIEITVDKHQNIHITPTIHDLDESIDADDQVKTVTDNWIQKTKVNYCQKLKKEASCLDFAYGATKVDLIAEESEIRRFETNIGDFIADTALAEFKLCHADIALINSGSIRLNYNIAANSNITRKHIEGMFPYPSNLKLIKINGKILKQMLTHTIDKWTANGHWLLVSGITYTHNPQTQQFSRLRWANTGKLINDNEEFTAIVPNYLIDAQTDHDGYHMINDSMIKGCVKNGSSLKQLVIDAIKSSPLGINPQVDGRICNTLRNDCKK